MLKAGANFPCLILRFSKIEDFSLNQLFHLRLADRGLPRPFPAHLLKVNFFISSYVLAQYAPTRGQKKSRNEKDRSFHDCSAFRLLAGEEIDKSKWVCKYFKNICFDWKRASSDTYFKRSMLILIVLLSSTEMSGGRCLDIFIYWKTAVIHILRGVW